MSDHRTDTDPGRAHATVQLKAEQHVGELGLLVEGPRRVGPLAGQIVEVDRATPVLGGTYGDHPRVPAAADRVEQQPGQREMPEVVGRELGLEALRGEPTGRVHHPGVVDEHVHRDPVSRDRRGEVPHRVQVGEVECPELDGGARLRRLDPGDGIGTFRLAAGGQHNPAAVGGELAGRLEAQAAVAAGDDEGPAGLISDPVRGPVIHGCYSWPASAPIAWSTRAGRLTVPPESVHTSTAALRQPSAAATKARGRGS